MVPLIYPYPCYHFFRSFWTFYNEMALSFCKGDQKAVNFLGKAGKIGGVTPQLSLATSCLGLVTQGGVVLPLDQQSPGHWGFGKARLPQSLCLLAAHVTIVVQHDSSLVRFFLHALLAFNTNPLQG